VNVDEARALVALATGANLDGAWHLAEFPAGWTVVRDQSEGLMGAATIAVEKATGLVLSFPSSVPPLMVRTQWERVRSRGKVMDTAS
jgi:hypothetical protein